MYFLILNSFSSAYEDTENLSFTFISDNPDGSYMDHILYS
jgi:hypothetical protein